MNTIQLTSGNPLVMCPVNHGYRRICYCIILSHRQSVVSKTLTYSIRPTEQKLPELLAFILL